MPSWLNELWDLLFANTPRRRFLFRRRMRLTAETIAWVRAPERTAEERPAFADLLVRLDSDPFTHSAVLLMSGSPPGLRWAMLQGRRIVIRFDPVEDRVTIISVGPAAAE